MQGFDAINMLSKGVGGYNSIGDYNKMLNLNGTNLTFDTNKPLQGQVQFDAIGDIDSIKDKELVSDLKKVTGVSTDENGVGESSSPDKLYKSFQNALSDGINKLNNAERTAESNIETFATGGNIDIHTVMLSAEKANLSMQLAMQLKTKIVGAYKELSKMQI